MDRKVNVYRKSPSGGPLSYSIKGAATVRPQAHGGRAKLSRPTGIYHGSNKSSTRGK